MGISTLLQQLQSCYEVLIVQHCFRNHNAKLEIDGTIITSLFYDLNKKNRKWYIFSRIVEAFKWAYAERSILGDPSDEEYADQINEVPNKSV